MTHQPRLVAPPGAGVELPWLLEVLVGRGLQAGQLEHLRLAGQAAGPLLRPGPGRQPVEVGRPEPAERSGQQPHQPVAARRVLDHPEQADEVVDLGREEQATEADDLDRQVARLERLDHQRELRPLPAQHRRAETAPPPTRRAPTVARPSRRRSAASSSVGLQASRLHATGAGVRPSAQRRDDLRAQRRRGGVGDAEDGVVVAPAGPQRQHLRVAALVGELAREPGQRRRARAAPAVDRLVRVAHRGDADPGTGRVARTPNRDRSITSCASEVSWNSSSSTARNRVRSVTPMPGTDRASRAASAIWSPKSIASRCA